MWSSMHEKKKKKKNGKKSTSQHLDKKVFDAVFSINIKHT